jgi:transposase
MYSLDLRKVACGLYQKYCSARKVAIILEVSHSSICRWVKNIQRKHYSRKPKLCSDFVIDTIKTSLSINPFHSIRSLVQKVKEVCNILVSRELIRCAILKIGFTKKKCKHKSLSTNIEEKVKEFQKARNHYLTEQRIFFSLDETSFGRNGVEVKGYSYKGKPLIVDKPSPRMTTTSSLVIASERCIIKHQEIQGSYNKQLFLQFLMMCPIPPRSVILLDNVKFHHSKEVKEFALQQEWILLYIPPYSPWYNPIEGIFSVLKRHYYKSLNIKDAFSFVTQHHCQSFFRQSLLLNNIPKLP